MGIKMNANPTKLLTLLGDQKTIFKIPVYQRKYEWSKEQITQYFTDIERIIESDFQKKHFFGTIVYVQNELPELMKERLVIDGQQRITTTMLFLKALMDIIEEKSVKSIDSSEIREIYLTNPHAKGENKNKLQLVDTDKLAYEKLMNGEKTNSRIYENYLIHQKKTQFL